MPKKPKRPEADIRAMIVKDSKMRLGCSDFAPEFTIYEVRNPAGNWEVRIAGDTEGWPPNCSQAFREAVDQARRKFDIVWPWP